MAGMFIDVQVEASVAGNAELARKLSEVCPVDIFALQESGGLRIAEENLDECTLCNLCLEAVPKGLRVLKLYE